MGSVKALNTGGVGHIKVAPLCFNNGIARLYDSTDGLIVECRLKQLDNDGLLFEGHLDDSQDAIITNLKIEENDIVTLNLKGKMYTFTKGKWFDENPKRGIQYKAAKISKENDFPCALFLKDTSSDPNAEAALGNFDTSSDDESLLQKTLIAAASESKLQNYDQTQ